MGRRLRFIPQGGALVEVTCRTIQGRLLLRPSNLLRDIAIGVLARAARLYPVDVHAFVFMSNHYHLLVSAPDAQRLARFVGYLNSNLAREVCRLTGWGDRVWSRRYHSIVVSDESKAQVARLKYVLSHGVKEGLVEHPSKWPGANSISALLADGALQGVWFNRTLEWAARQRGESFNRFEYSTRETLKLEPLPCWTGRDQATLVREITALVKAICLEAEVANLNPRRLGSRLQRVLRRNPQTRPEKLKRTPAPRFHCASKRARDKLHHAYHCFVQAHREGAESVSRGSPSSLFPPGSFPSPLPFVAAHPAGHLS